MKYKILLVDDEVNILNAYHRNLRSSYDVVTADSGYSGINIFKEQGPFAVVVSDYRMPKMDGIEFLANVKMIDPNSSRIMLTGQADLQTAINAINEGNIFRFLTKPCAHDFLLSVIDTAVGQYELIMSEKILLEKTLRGSVKVLIDLLAMLNPAAFSQSARLRNLAKKLSLRLNQTNIWEIEVTALLSQIGGVTIPNEIISKVNKGALLNEKEESLYSKHPFFAKNLIVNIPRLEKTAEGIFYQMKNYDGSGFPGDDIKGKDIPFLGRLLRIIIEFDNLLKKGIKPEKALITIRHNMKYFDPDIFKALEAEVLLLENGFIIKEILLRELMIGMVLGDDILNEKGVVLVAKNFEISDAIKTRLLNYASMNSVVEPIKVLVLAKNE
jgi:response regulator RpfG family c-di-GMP phosphodiesterase